MSNIRKLVAIMFTDIVGYTKLMRSDEQKTLKLLDENKNIHQSIIERYNGLYIKDIGDGILASFDTASDAVTAAIQIQKDVLVLNKYQLRIGIHLAEVVFRNNDVYGDGVNIASRIQASANPESIFISEAVYQNIVNKRDIKTHFVKEDYLKNVKDSVKIYRVSIDEGSSENFKKNEKFLPRKALLLFLLTLIISFIILQITSPSKDTKTHFIKKPNAKNVGVSLNVYPNPASKILTISISTLSKTIQQPIIKILNSNGAIVHSSEFQPIQQAFITTIDISSLNKAEYTVQLFDRSSFLQKTIFFKE